MGYWGSGYWGDGYWADGYWAGDETPAVVAGSLYVDRSVEVIKFTLQRKDGTGSDTFLISQDYWAAGTLYTDNPEIYPVLAGPVATTRGTDRVQGTVNDITVNIYGKSHFDGYGKTFFDLVDTHEFRNGDVQVRRYFRAPNGVSADADSVNLRQVLKLNGYTWQADVLGLECRDFTFDDKEVSKRLKPEDFDDLQEDYQYAYGAIAFGNGNASEGVVIDAPFISSQGGTDVQSATLFTGWTFPNHPNFSAPKVYVQNPTKNLDDAEYLDVSLVSNAALAWHGDNNLPDIGDQPGRHLSLYHRGIVVSPSSQSRILTAVLCQLLPSQGHWAADFNGANNLFIEDEASLGPGDESFTVMTWVKFDDLREQALCGKGNLNDGTAEWFLYMNAAHKLAFGISSEGWVNDAEAVWGTAIADGNWYWVTAWHDKAARTVNISVNNGTAVSVSTVLNSGTVTGAANATDSAKAYIQLAASATTTVNAYKGMTFRLTTPGDENFDQTKEIFSSSAAKRVTFLSGWSPLCDTSDTYEIFAAPERKRRKTEDKGEDLDKAGPFQVGYTGGITNHLDGRMCCLGFYKGVLGATHRTSIYNGGNGKVHQGLTEDEKAVKDEHSLISWWNLDEFYGEREDLQGSRDLLDAASVGSAVGKLLTAVLSEKGEVKVSVFQAKFLPESGTWTTEGGAIRTTTVDPAELEFLSTFGYPIAFPIDPVLPLSPNASYFVTVEFTNAKEHPYSFRCNYEVVGGQTHYWLLTEEKGLSWVAQADTQLSMGLYVIGDSDGGFTDTTGAAPYHSEYSITASQGAVTPAMEFPLLTKDTNYKLGIRGIEDDTSGTYTGSASSLLRSASDILRFALMNPDFGRGLTSARVDTASLDATRAALGTVYRLSFAIDRQLRLSDLIRKICTQTGTILYKSRIGKLTHHFPTWHAETFDATISEQRYRDQMALLAVQDVPDEAVFNDFLVNYGVDPLNMPKTPDFVFRAGSNSYSSTVYLNGDESSSDDTAREARMAESRALYGELQYRTDFDMYAADSPAPQAVVNRLADRYYKKVKRPTIRVLLKDFYTHDLFDTLSLRHTELPCEGGASKRVLLHDGGAAIAWTDKGVPATWMKTGAARGEIVNWVEYDQWVDITIETMNPF